MNPTAKHLLGVAAAITIAAPALLGTAASPAVAAAGAHCDRAQQDMWDNGPSRNVTALRCDIPSHRNRWYTVEIDTLVQTRYKGDTLDGGVDRTRTLHDRTIRCLGYTSDPHKGTVNWFGCPPF
ncbi:hypothetical protein [Streptomyces similanensis]|uniref:Secreted protein n=1 Tax=Streptomyces similanensis TaxID=1274988 RepID=A0ABP9KB87_9ACTN|nr:hypothetical protein HUT11_35060 [Streptomyces seoulensis]